MEITWSGQLVSYRGVACSEENLDNLLPQPLKLVKPKNGELTPMPIYFYNYKAGKTHSTTAPSLKHALTDTVRYLKEIPIDDHVNLAWGLASVASPRILTDATDEQKEAWLTNDWKQQDAIVFDIDGVPNDDSTDKYIDVFARVVKLPESSFSVIFSGNGLHFYILLKNPIKRPDFFKANRSLYKDLCAELDEAVKAAGLPGHFDPSIFDHNRVMRVPGSINLKDGVKKQCYPVRISDQEVEWSLGQVLGMGEVTEKSALSRTEYESLKGSYDVDAIQEGCKFLKWTREQGELVREPQGYAALSILSRLDKDGKIAREYYQGWTHSEALRKQDPDKKIAQARERSLPLRCDTIHQKWTNGGAGDSCASCPHFGVLRSPIQLRGPNFIAHADTFFWKVTMSDSGKLVRQTAHEDLAKQFSKDYPNFYDGAATWIYNGRCYTRPDTPKFVESYVHSKTANPQTGVEGYSEAQTRKVTFLIELTDPKSGKNREWREKSGAGLINLKNGLLDTKTGLLLPHTPDICHLYSLPFDYDPGAGAPVWEKFLESIFPGDKACQNYLEQFMGYCLSGDQMWYQKAVILLGEGGNGKSPILELIPELAGAGNFSAVKLDKFSEDYYVEMLNGKLVNISGESGEKGFKEVENFKALVTGDKITARQIYKEPVVFNNRAKIIFSVNKLPNTVDRSVGFFRRLVILPFSQRFVPGENADLFITDKLKLELSGIFNRVHAAYKAAKERGYLDEPKVAKEQLAEFEADQDYLGEAVTHLCEYTGSDADFLPTSELQNALRRQAQLDGQELTDAMLHPRTIKKSLTKNWPRVEAMRRRVGSDYLRGFTRLHLTPVHQAKNLHPTSSF